MTPVVPAPVATGPEGLAARLADVERAVRDPATPEAGLGPLGETEELATHQLVDHPDCIGRVLALLAGQARPIVAANADAVAELRAITPPRTALPPWRVVPPRPAAELMAYYREAERLSGVPWYWLAAVHHVETRMGRIRGTSTAGAQGPMQFLPATWSVYGRGGDIYSDHDSILAAARLLAANGAPARTSSALSAYNHSSHYVAAVTDYALQMRSDERAYLAYYHWQVVYRLVTGDVILPEGYRG